MIKKLLPILLLLVGSGAGVGAGVFLRPAPDPSDKVELAEGGEAPGAETPDARDGSEGKGADAGHGGQSGATDRDYVKMSNQFVIPVVERGAVSALVLISLSIETDPGFRDAIFQREPKLRDSFLQVLFDHANVGGFRGDFTDASNLEVLRAALREVAMRDAGEHVSDVLIHEIARQDY